MLPKEAARRALSSRPVMGTLRRVTASSHLPLEHRKRLYYRVGKPVRPAVDLVFTHRLPGAPDLRFHYAGTVRQLHWLGEYETDALPWFAAYAADADAVVDVGAAEGTYTLVAAAVGRRSRIVACEPGDLQGERLEANLALNSAVVADRVTVLPIALSDHGGSADFFQLPGGTSSLNPDFRAGSPSRRVLVARGDEVLPPLLEGRVVDLVKIDVESAEGAVLAGLSGVAAEHRPVILCEVLAGRDEDRVQAFVDEHRYRAWWLGPDGPERRAIVAGDRTARHVNWLFLPDDGPPRPPRRLR